MEAIHKQSGRKVTILGISKEYGTVSYIENGILKFGIFASGEYIITDDSEPIDWGAYRREVAKEIVASMVTGSGKWDDKTLVKNALILTDELIKQLKEK